jgi:PadR family transcriptional regulator, regulatory protein PadR
MLRRKVPVAILQYMTADRASTLLKGVLDICVLALLDQEQVYGYELAARLRSRGVDVGGGSIYPLLARLERAGDVRSIERPSPDGPPRKYWTLTATGRRTLADGREVWTRVADGITATLMSGHTAKETTS